MSYKNISIEELKNIAKELRINTIETCFNATSGHVGGSLSCADVLVALYFKYLNIDPTNPEKEDRDRFILSKGHAALSYVPCLAMAGFLDLEEVKAKFNKTDSKYGMHPDSKKIRGCDCSTGSLGHGLPIACGMALGLKKKGFESKVVCLTGDGELQEGSNYEAAMAASHYHLNNLIWIVDRNKFEIDGPTEEVMALEPLDKKAEAFGMHVIKINGNKMSEVDAALKEAYEYKDGPVCIIASSYKGMGLVGYQGQVTSHYVSLGDDKKVVDQMINYIKENDIDAVVDELDKGSK